MANPAATLRALHQGPDPRAVNPASLFTAYDATDGGLQSATLLRQSTNCHEALVFLVHPAETNDPLPLTVPFNLDVPGGANNTNETYAMVGDINDAGVHPSLVVIDEAVFDRVQNVTVPTNATTRALWNALPDAQHWIPRPAANTEQVTVRHVVPIPHPYVTPILQAHLNEELNWRWLLVNTFEPILADVNQTQHYAQYLNWFRAASTLRGNGQRSPVHLGLGGVFGRSRILQAVPTVLSRYLPGMRGPTNLHTTMQQLVQHQQTLGTQLARVAQPPAKTLMDTHPVLAQNALKMSEQSDLNQLTPFWQNLHLVSKQGYLAALQQAVHASPYPPPLISPSFATTFMSCNWVASHGSAIKEGITLTRMQTFANGPEQLARHAQSTLAYNILEVYNSTGADLVQMVLTDEAACLPRNTTELSACIKADYAFKSQIWGPNASQVDQYRTQLVDRLEEITQLIIREYYTHQHEVCLKIVVFIFRLDNNATGNLIRGPVPTAANPRPNPQRPTYGAIRDALLAGNIRTLVDLPEGLLHPTRPAPTPRPSLTPTPAPAPAPSPTPAPSPGGASRRPVTGDPTWNVQLRGSWAATGNRALFTTGSPFYRANTPPKNRVVLKRLAGDRSRTICLKMALTNECMDNCTMYHGQLNQDECQAIAREGGFTL